MNRRIKALSAELNQGKKYRGKGWQTKKQCWRIASAEWNEMRRQAARRP
jgi:hypothetical protein